MTDAADVDAGDGAAVIDLAGVAFSRRFANLLSVGRAQLGVSRRALAKRSGGRFTSRDLKVAESAKRQFGPSVVGELAVLYGVDLAVILPERLPLRVGEGVVTTGGIETRFESGDEESLLTAYLRLVRALRRQQHARVVDLRRDDIDVLAAHLGAESTDVVDRLGALMGASRSQRRTMVTMFDSGATVIGLSAGVQGGSVE